MLLRDTSRRVNSGVRFLLLMKTTIFLRALSVIALLVVPMSLGQAQNPGIKSQKGGQIDYKVWRIVSFTDERGRYWLAFISVAPNSFNRDGMSSLNIELSQRYRRIRRMKAFLFDDPKLAEAHAAFRVELRSLEQNMRGLYYRDKYRDEAYIKYSSGEGKRWDEIRIDFGKMRSRDICPKSNNSFNASGMSLDFIVNSDAIRGCLPPR
jgi:hypothetical protein